MAKQKKQAAGEARALTSAATAPAPESTPAPTGVTGALTSAATTASSVPKKRKTTAQPAPTAADAARDGSGGNFRDQALRLLSGDLTALAGNADVSGALTSAATAAAPTGEDDSDTGEGESGGEALEAPAAGTEPAEEDSHLADSDSESGAPTSAATGETEGEGEGEGEGEIDEEDLNALAELDDATLDAHAKAKQWPASFHKRIKKFAKQHRQAVAHEARLSERLAELEQQLSGTHSAQPSSPMGAREGGAASLHEQALWKDIDLRESALAQIDAHLSSPEGLAGQPLEVGGQSFSIAQLRAEERKFEWEVNQARAQLHALRQTNEANRRQFDSQAVAHHPWLKDPRHADTAAIEGALREYPILAQVPRIRLILADHLAYRKQLAEAGAGQATANGNRQPGSNGQARSRPPAPAARAPARPAAAPLPAARAETDGRAAVSQVMKTGTYEDAKKALPFLIESRLR